MDFKKLLSISRCEIKQWNKKCANNFISSKDNKIIINRNKKWNGVNNYNFLLEIKEYLNELTIIDFSDGVNIEVLEYLLLEKLTLEVGINCIWPKAFPQSLNHLSICCSNDTPNITSLRRLESLSMWGTCNWHTLPRFESPMLKILSLDSSKLRSLFKEEQESLTKLEISGPKDLSLDGLQYCKNLESLDLIDLRGHLDLSPIVNLGKLRRLSIDGRNLRVSTITPICESKNLTWLYLGNTKVLDGKISDLGLLPQLKIVGFNDRKSNDISLREFLIRFNCNKISL